MLLLKKKLFTRFREFATQRSLCSKDRAKFPGINFFPTRLQRENAMIIINVTFRYVLPTRLQRANAVIIINVTIRYVLPTRLQRACKCSNNY